jgi:hypothetical protein
VGDSLLANRASESASPQPNIRWQACLLQGAGQAFVFVGASLLAKGGGKRASPHANIRWQASSHKDKPLRKALLKLFGLM